ncbi:ScbR family autoregulator-binding transcription factor [Streptomyces sp. NPDC059649]|uniref:ScbR family autoregulator-binding transcription factor n=1 Tax=Streptomyces sp. NPDC059649 TaxID=3346895 RepID=UPI0036CB1757
MESLVARHEQAVRPPQQERARQTRLAIVRAAAELFDKHGYGGTKIADVVDRIGMTKGALYFHFPDKESLAVAVMEAQMEGLSVPPQVVKTQELVDAGYALAHLLRSDPIQRGATRLTMDQDSDQVDRTRSMQLWLSFTESILVEARKREELLDIVEISEASNYFVGAFAGIQNMAHAFDDRTSLVDRLTVLWKYTLPSIVRPAIVTKLKLDPARGERIAHGAAPSDT